MCPLGRGAKRAEGRVPDHRPAAPFDASPYRPVTCSVGCYSVAMDEPTPSDTVHVAIDDLLAVVAKTADDLHAFHATLTHARIAPQPPFPRATVVLTVRIVDHLRKTEELLRDVLLALGLSGSPPI